MSKQFEGVFELFQEQPRRQVNGDKLQIVLEKPFTEQDQKDLVDFFDQSVQVKIREYIEGDEKKTSPVMIDDIFEVTAVKLRRLANGNKTSFVLEKMYDRDNHRRVVDLFSKDVSVFMEIIQQELPGMEDREEETSKEQDESLGLELVEN